MDGHKRGLAKYDSCVQDDYHFAGRLTLPEEQVGAKGRVTLDIWTINSKCQQLLLSINVSYVGINHRSPWGSERGQVTVYYSRNHAQVKSLWGS
jgi:hypothetical protein